MTLQVTKDPTGRALIQWREQLDRIAPGRILSVGLLRDWRQFSQRHGEDRVCTDGEIIRELDVLSVQGGTYLILEETGERQWLHVYASDVQNEDIRKRCEETLAAIVSATK